MHRHVDYSCVQEYVHVLRCMWAVNVHRSVTVKLYVCA